MKKRWNEVKITNLSVRNTREGQGYVINPEIGPGKCSVCNQGFATGAAYENHKVEDSYQGQLIGTECPDSPKGDGRLTAEFILFS